MEKDRARAARQRCRNWFAQPSQGYRSAGSRLFPSRAAAASLPCDNGTHDLRPGKIEQASQATLSRGNKLVQIRFFSKKYMLQSRQAAALQFLGDCLRDRCLWPGESLRKRSAFAQQSQK